MTIGKMNFGMPGKRNELFLQNFLNLLKISRKVYRANSEEGFYHRYVKKQAAEIIAQSKALNDGTIESKVYRKIQWYMVSTLFMGELLAELAGVKLSESENRTFICLGAVGGLSDILIDDQGYEKEKMFSLLGSNDSDVPIGQVFILYRHALYESLNPNQKPLMDRYLKELFYWQSESLKQFNKDISEREVEKISYGKGGLSIQLCAIILSETNDKMLDALYKLGGFIQLMNDAQDYPKDIKECINTFMMYRRNFQEAFLYLEEKRRESFEAIWQLTYDSARKSYFLFCFYAMYIGIVYKLKRYSEVSAGSLSTEKWICINKSESRVSPFSVNAALFCCPKILTYKTGNLAPAVSFIRNPDLP